MKRVCGRVVLCRGPKLWITLRLGNSISERLINYTETVDFESARSGVKIIEADLEIIQVDNQR